MSYFYDIPKLLKNMNDVTNGISEFFDSLSYKGYDYMIIYDLNKLKIHVTKKPNMYGSEVIHYNREIPYKEIEMFKYRAIVEDVCSTVFTVESVFEDGISLTYLQLFLTH